MAFGGRRGGSVGEGVDCGLGVAEAVGAAGTHGAGTAGGVAGGDPVRSQAAITSAPTTAPSPTGSATELVLRRMRNVVSTRPGSAFDFFGAFDPTTTEAWAAGVSSPTGAFRGPAA